ncbi:hypothetical protein CYY_009672 [Polysphondylium violaceum]|uniref:Carbohydrate binding domain-containing protein n=1 Tax=Polysphondylium violaceum TaxID=133409 RepID=A0A8J4PKX5_9MYCE|nr:hypothetical protein CYY_009672 [Polysphondylium violaceum]
MKLILSIIVLLCCIATLKAEIEDQSICHGELAQLIYDEGLGDDCQDWSWSSTKDLANSEFAHNGEVSMSFYPKNYDGIYFALEDPIDPSLHSYVSMWIHGGKSGNQKINFKFTSNKTAVSDDYVTWGEDSIIGPNSTIIPRQWVNALIKLDSLEPGEYDGIQILTKEPNDQGKVFIDVIEVYKRCEKEKYTKDAPIEHCEGMGCLKVKVKPDPEVHWMERGVEFQQYEVSMKNLANSSITVLEFQGNWFKPRNITKDIWDAIPLEGGVFGLPPHVQNIFPGQSYTFGCVSAKGPVSFNITYMEFAE